MQDLFEVLQIRLDSDLPEIKRNFKKLSLIYHPDRIGYSADGAMGGGGILVLLAHILYRGTVYQNSGSISNPI
jgi:hypothetical protein